MEIPLSSTVDLHDTLLEIFLRKGMERSYAYRRFAEWGTDAIDQDNISGTPQMISYRDQSIGAVWEFEDSLAIVYLNMASTKVSVDILAASFEKMGQIESHLRSAFKATEVEEGEVVPIRFWTNSPRGPKSVSRKIVVPNFSDVNENYHCKTHDALAHMVNGFKPSHGGQLILWHGLPGTGKTYALRTLASEWRKWCKFEYIVDPEEFFGGSPAYMLDVLMDSGPNFLSDDDDEEAPKAPWRLLIFEDTGELLSKDAKIRSGAGLGRLLNVVDGLIGQGLQVLILITTNEELGSLHPAVSRPGRAAMKILFEKLNPEESGAWQDRHGVDPIVYGSHTLAELYGRLEGFEAAPEPVPVGFRRRTA